MTEQGKSADDKRLGYRRAMRTSAMIFLVLSAIGFFATVLVALGGEPENYPPDILLERAFYAFALMVSAAMSWHGSRFGALFLLLIVMSGFLALLSPGGVGVGLVRTLLYTSLAIFMLWNAQRYHRACAAAGEPIDGSPIVRWGGIALVLPVAGLVAMGVLVMLNPLTPHVLTPGEMKEDHFRWLVEKNYLTANEAIEFFYAEGLVSLSEGGALLTDKYVGVWAEEADGLNDYWLKLGEICSVETLTEGDRHTDAQYTAYGADEDTWITLVLSTQHAGHERFIRRMNVLNRMKMHPLVKAACESGKPIDREALGLANGISPDIVAGGQIAADHLDWMREHGVLQESETPLSFYSRADYHIEETGTLLTDQYFGGWYQTSGQIGEHWAKIGEICTLEPVDWDNDGGDAIYKITFGADNWYQFPLPKADGQDKRLVKRVRAMNEAAVTSEFTEACASNPFLERSDIAE